MSADLDIIFDFRELEAFTDRLCIAADKEAPPIMAEVVRKDTLERFDRGVDENDSQWQGYSAAHKKTREKLGYQTAYVDHTMTGQLRSSFRFDQSKGTLGVPPVLKGRAEGTVSLRDWIEPSKIALDLGAVYVAERLEQVR